MKQFVKWSLLVAIFLGTGLQTVQAQKKVKSFQVARVINVSADKVWKIVGEDYGAIANSHPAIITSDYVSGSLKAGEGAERVCNFDDKGKQYLKEKQVGYDPANYTFKNQVYQAGKFPVVPEYTFAIYKIVPIDDNSCRFEFDMTYRTSPAIIGGMMKNNFIKLINDYTIAIEHHVKTGENVTKDNFKEIKKQYTK